jgi:hypothetical protein
MSKYSPPRKTNATQKNSANYSPDALSGASPQHTYRSNGFGGNRLDRLGNHLNKIDNIVGNSLTAEDMKSLTALGFKDKSIQLDKISPYSILRSSRNDHMQQTVK